MDFYLISVAFYYSGNKRLKVQIDNAQIGLRSEVKTYLLDPLSTQVTHQLPFVTRGCRVKQQMYQAQQIVRIHHRDALTLRYKSHVIMTEN